MKKVLPCIMLLATAMLVQLKLPAQGFLKKLKETADKALDKKINDKLGTSNDNTNTTNTSNTDDGSVNKGSTKATNKSGGGLNSTVPPDVLEQMNDADKAYASKNYNEARYSVQQALLGVELQIGKLLLKSLPATVGSLPADTTEDKVISTSWGWANLNISRLYKKDDKELNVSIGNNQLYSGIANVYFNSAFAVNQTNGTKENMKQIKVKGNKALIQYDDSEGYTVLVPLGQSGIIAWTGVNFTSENEMMNAVNAFDIDKVKSLLGEK